MIGGGGERLTLRVVAQHADWWNCDYYAPAEYARKLSVLREHCRAIGRDPEAIVPTCYMGLTVSHDAGATGATTLDGPSWRGPRRSAATRTRSRRSSRRMPTVGVRHMQLNFLDFPRTDSLDLFMSEVFPRFTRAGT